MLQRLEDTLGWLTGLVADREVAGPVDDAARIDRIALVERLQASLVAVKAVEIVAFASRARATGIARRRAEEEGGEALFPLRATTK